VGDYVAIPDPRGPHGAVLLITSVEWEELLQRAVRPSVNAHEGITGDSPNDEAGLPSEGITSSNYNLSAGLGRSLTVVSWVNKPAMAAVLGAGLTYQSETLVGLGCFLLILDQLSMHIWGYRLVKHEQALNETQWLREEIARLRKEHARLQAVVLLQPPVE
jgi:hypothetical protein